MSPAPGPAPAAPDLLAAARTAVAGDRRALDRIEECERQLHAPLRIALTGSLKAGKSTLLNALVGQDIAPTDATECTRVVTWYRRGRTASVTACVDDGAAVAVPVTRIDGRLGFDLGALTADRIDRIEVTWPTRALEHRALVDTPGLASLSSDLSASTERLLAPEDGRPRVDAVIYLLRTLTAADSAMLRRITAAMGSSAGPLGVVGVVSRADELGAGRVDAMLSAQEIAARLTGELTRTGLCHSVLPVSGLLALGAQTLREREFRALLALASVSADDLESALLSMDRFTRPDILPTVDPQARLALADRLGVFGIRLAVTLIRFGTTTSSALSAELLARSGLSELSSLITVQFGQRAWQLKSHSALRTLDGVLAGTPGPAAAQLRSSVRRALADTHGFRELRLIGAVRAGRIGLPAETLDELSRLVGDRGVYPTVRLGLAHDATPNAVREAAIAAAARWRTRAAHPLADPQVVDAATVAVRSAEGIVADLGRPDPSSGPPISRATGATLNAGSHRRPE